MIGTNRIRGLMLAATLMAAEGIGAAIGRVLPGHSAAWYDPERDGEGWILEILPEDRAHLAWFTYDEEGKQRWITGVGTIVRGESDDEIRFEELIYTRGGVFGPDFDPALVERILAGTATMRFGGCDQGTFAFEAFGQSATIAVSRLTRTMGAGCGPIHGVPGEVVHDYAGLSGAWFDPSHDGEGWFLQWLSNGQALLTWYTYDSQGEQVWMIGVGGMEEGRIVFSELITTRGARFGEAFDPEDVERIPWGSVAFDLECAGGTASYAASVDGFGTGAFSNLVPLTRLDGVACPWLRPKLTELYDIALTELPIAAGTPMDANRIEASLVTDEGIVTAVRGRLDGYEVLRFDFDSGEWVPLPNGNLLIATRDVFQAPDGGVLLSTERPDQPETLSRPVRWTQEIGWGPLHGVVLSYSSIAIGASMNGTRVVGYGRNQPSGGDSPWIWDEARGQVVPEVTGEIPIGAFLTVSNDGRTAAGVTLEFPGGQARPKALRWVEGGTDPEVLTDTLGVPLGWPRRCDATCSIIFGDDQSIVDLDHPNARQAWYWRSPDDFAYLGEVEESFPFTYSAYQVRATTADGTMVVGWYATSVSAAEAFLWTQATGMVSVGHLLEELEIELPWASRHAPAISSNGRFVIIAGESHQPGSHVPHMRAAVLELSPRCQLGRPPQVSSFAKSGRKHEPTDECLEQIQSMNLQGKERKPEALP